MSKFSECLISFLIVLWDDRILEVSSDSKVVWEEILVAFVGLITRAINIRR